ncbi:MAG: phage tail tape measure protein family, partial [Rubritepida sp.]|nr:phage tail tape measure protein family [Rubritepida sp.]
MNRSLVARFILQFQDRTSAGLSALQRRLQGLQRMTGRFALLTGAVAGLSFLGPVQGAAALETRLRDVAITAGVTSDAISGTVNNLRAELNALALEYRLTTTGLLGATEVLTARGLSTDEIRAYTRVIAEVGAASGALETDLAQLGVAINRIAHITDAAGVRTAMAQLFRAGQLGGFELKDMARYLPGILAQMSLLEVRGARAIQNSGAMLQVIRDGMGDTEATARAAQQMIGHLFSESTQKNARDLGLDLPAIYNDALAQMRRGVDIDPMEAILMRMRQAIGTHGERVFALFPDENSRQAFTVLNDGFARYLELRNRVRQTEGSAVEAPARDRSTGLGAEMREFTERMSQFNDRIGRAFGFNLGFINGALSEFLGWIQEIDKTSPGTVDEVLKFAAGAVLLASGLAVLGFALGPIAAGVAALASPIGLTVLAATALGLAAWQIYENWDGIGAWFTRQWTGLGEVASREWDRIAGSEQAAWLMRQLERLSPVVTLLREGLEAVWTAVSRAWDASPLGIFFSSLSEKVQQLLAFIERLQAAWDRLRGTLMSGDAAQANAAGPALGNVQQRVGAAAA